MANTWGGTGFGTTKTPAAVRTIPVPAHVIEMLAEHLARFQAGDDGLLFTMEDGTPVRRSTWSDNYRKACRRAGVAKQTRTHDLRHVTASSLIAGGLSVKAVQAVLGHHSASETLDVYSHFWPSDEERTRTAIESVSATWLSG